MSSYHFRLWNILIAQNNDYLRHEETDEESKAGYINYNSPEKWLDVRMRPGVPSQEDNAAHEDDEGCQEDVHRLPKVVGEAAHLEGEEKSEEEVNCRQH